MAASSVIVERGDAHTLSMFTKLGWGVGSIGIATSAITVNIMLLTFMVTILGVEPSVAGAIVAGVRVLDIFVDIMVGTWSDRTISRWGRRRPWLLAGSVCSFLALNLLFSAPSFITPRTSPVYMSAALIFFYAAYSIFTVPYMAMPVEMSDSRQERTLLMSVRAGFLSVGGLIGVGLGPALIGWFGQGGPAYSKMALGMSAVVFVAMVTSFLTTRGARTLAPADAMRPKMSLDLLRTRSFACLLASKFLALFAVSINATMMLLFHSLITQRGPAGVALVGLVSSIAALLFLPVWLRLARHVPKRWLYIAAMVIFSIAMASWSLSGPRESNGWFYLRAIAAGVGSGAITFLSGALLPEAIEDDRRRSGIFREGTLAGMFIATEKTAFAAAPLVAGLILSMTGFRGGLGAAGGAQSTAATLGVLLAASIVPACAALIGILPALGAPRATGSDDIRQA
ncbi:GPH family glycoside/pentoside/hexuronide:cation symporter [Sphingomonas vulcanisoli]|uniref:GPH family glycoside/pentoside/hexuronide:cation symporter n=1 Tax=Sphingomonas vulcanisoli TaxID=1658060 RepID=A0ABX0TXY2_9SPHN|nr:MFS transporter [Sphingomonas vulcanisoli]NIJ08501.1 GPH family glycoside/pentoside/hexuronide:cation symporter [Sphingomonas vulcanisoli]